ncbi:site-2 protease family protein [Streptomyces hirsutus]|uniref:Zinc metalloprotease n=1 Tax=Streptomyces hirsutus TaxID=35620 RepID=A0ABZ1GPQ4_9ACTN|nr:site-2 protease family protein [Streptomyces hirsutus]WSD07195.1 site-2 protease family protein [Streptomyces hirsutus]WTD19388.1 site-2 protease family protein [Streptomyces hirsutus]WTD75682.1 site-2 protease family protein [Streptomyces sp. NBC_01635]
MRATFVLGRIAGVRVGVHWSVLFIFGIIVFGLSQGRLPETHPGRAWALYWAAGLCTALVFFASLLAHELAHAVVARRNGVEVDDIVLWFLGGAARLRTEASSPGAELRIAGVGPLVSLLLGGLFALGAWLLDLASGPGVVVEMVAWLAGINVLLAVFNALPAAPLDGGRLLRAFLWWRTGDRLRATAGATAAGRVLGWLLVALGLIAFMRTGTFGALWLALIGWFLIAAATAEGRQAQLRGVLAGVPVRDAMTPEPLTVPADTTVAGFLTSARYRYRHSAFPVIDDGVPVGLVTLDSARKVPQAEDRAVTVREVMMPLSQTTVVGPDSPLADLLPRMEPGAEHRVLVVDDGRLVGIVSLSDVSRTMTWLMRTAPGRRDGL